MTAAAHPNLSEYVTMSSTTLAAGATTTVTAIDLNLGPVAAPGSAAGIYLSTDSTITTADTLLTTVTSPGLAATGQTGYYDVQNVQVTLPGNLAPGTYFIGGIADNANAVAESIETDNTLNTVTITVGQPNLSEYVVVSNTALSAGASTTVTAIDLNLGAFSSPGSTAGIYLSSDSTITTSDTLLITVTSPGLAATCQTGYYDLQNVLVSMPGNPPPGTHFPGGTPDQSNAVAESNEADNTLNTVKITVG